MSMHLAHLQLKDIVPYEYQLRSAQFLFDCEYGLGADEMGLGKTLEAMLVVLADRIDNPDAKTLVVCPNILKLNWVREFQKHTNLTAACFRKSKHVPREFTTDVIVINYEQLKHAARLFQEASIVIADECHYLTNTAAKRTTMFKTYLRKNLRRLVLLSGTPIKNRVQELYSILDMLSLCPSGKNGVKLSQRFARIIDFCEHFCYSIPSIENGRHCIRYRGLRNESDLADLLRQKMVRHLVKDCIDLPSVTRTIYETETPADQIFDLELMRDWLDYQATRRVQYLAARKAACAVYKTASTVSRVLELSLAGCSPILVFTDHVDSCTLICDALAKTLRVASVSGEVSATERQAYIDAFQRGDLDALVATIPTLQAGVTLTASNRIVFNDLPWEPASLEQAAKRIHRIGQTRPCFVDIISITGVDTMISKCLLEKTKIINKVLSPIEKEFQ